MSTFISLFSGAGGLDVGFTKAGWNPIFMTDVWEPAVKTLKKNHDCRIECADIINIKEDYIRNIVDNNSIDAVIGGPPCQAFSRLNQNQIFKDGQLTEDNLNDPRRSLFMDFLRLCSYIKPKFIVMENVPDLKTKKLGGTTERKDHLIINIISEEFNKIGYNVIFNVLNSKDYNVPQMRKRIIFIASRLDIALSFPKKMILSTSVQNEFSQILPHHPNQDRKTHSDAWRHKVSFIPQGGYYNDLPVELKKLNKVDFDFIQSYNGQVKEYCFVENSNYICFKKSGDVFIDLYGNEISIDKSKMFFKIMPRMGSYLRRINNNISHTITRNPLIHPDEDRELTIREKASIQTFPLDYEFIGSLQEQHILIGNAVPCNLGMAIANHLNLLISI